MNPRLLYAPNQRINLYDQVKQQLIAARGKYTGATAEEIMWIIYKAWPSLYLYAAAAGVLAENIRQELERDS